MYSLRAGEYIDLEPNAFSISSSLLFETDFFLG